MNKNNYSKIFFIYIKPTMIDIINPQVEERIPCAKKNANELRRTHYTLGSQRK